MLTYKEIPVRIQLSRFYFSYTDPQLFYLQHLSAESQFINCESSTGICLSNSTPLAVFTGNICFYVLFSAFLLAGVSKFSQYLDKEAVWFWNSRLQILTLWANCWSEQVNDGIPSSFYSPCLGLANALLMSFSLFWQMFSVQCPFCHKGFSSLLWLQLCSFVWKFLGLSKVFRLKHWASLDV